MRMIHVGSDGRSFVTGSGGCETEIRSAGFNRIELLVVIATLALLAQVWLPAFAKANTASKSSQCLNNLNFLVRAWSLYAADNNDRLVMNYHGGEAQMGSVARNPSAAPWALGWQDWSTSPDNTNYLFLTDSKYSHVASYLGHESKVFKCPADTYISAAQKARGWKERVRSVSASVGIGDGNAESGPWLPIYKHVRKLSDLQFPGPAETWVYVDEHPDSMNEPAFFSSGANSWIDLPATYHDGLSNFAFADGHVAGHRWTGSLNTIAVRRVRFAGFNPPVPRAGDPDIVWLSYHTARISEKSN